MEFAVYFAPAATATDTAIAKPQQSARPCSRSRAKSTFAIEILMRPV